MARARRPSRHQSGFVDVRTTLEQDAASRAIGELRLPAEASKLGEARAYAYQAAAQLGLDADSCYEFAFAVNEAVTNAIRHGAPDEHGYIHLSVFSDGDGLTLAIRDYGTFVERGRGFALMSQMVDTVQLCVESGSTTVLLSMART
jgi:anti-sigma regulatory factor (Ser/Thr protein kinase)